MGILPSTLLRVYHIGENVDIKANAAVQTGIPHKSYHGRTGLVWNVSKRAVGVEIKKRVRTRKIRKRLYIRSEHVQPSRCREEFNLRIRKIHFFHNQKESYYGQILPEDHELSVKRQPQGPKPANVTLHQQMISISPIIA